MLRLERMNRRVGHALWLFLCTMIIIGLMATVIVITLSRPGRVSDLGGNAHQLAALALDHSSSYSSASSFSRA